MPLDAPDPADLHFAVLENYVLNDLSPLVAATFEAEIAALEKAGIRISRVRLPFLEDLPALNARGGIVAAEALRLHRSLLATSEAGYDPRVSAGSARARRRSPANTRRC